MELVGAYYPGVDNFGERLRRVREALDLNQVSIGRRVRRTKAEAAQFGKYLSRLETGIEANPSLELLEDIAKGMGLTLSQFFAQLEDTASVSPTSNTQQNTQNAAARNMNIDHHDAAQVARDLAELRVEFGILATRLFQLPVQTGSQSAQRKAPKTRRTLPGKARGSGTAGR